MALIAFSISGLILALIALVFGVIVLAFPRALSYIVGVYLLLVGIFGILSSVG